jgi:hypothetical protein
VLEDFEGGGFSHLPVHVGVGQALVKITGRVVQVKVPLQLHCPVIRQLRGKAEAEAAPAGIVVVPLVRVEPGVVSLVRVEPGVVSLQASTECK